MSAAIHPLSSRRTPGPGVVQAKPLDPGPGSGPGQALRRDDSSPEARARIAVAEKSAAIAENARLRRERIRGLVLYVLPPIAGMALLVLVWTILTMAPDSRLPSPAKTWSAAVALFSKPFYIAGPNDQGIGWNVLSSLQRVGIGFGLAALLGIPLGFAIGRFDFLNRMTAPIISLLRPVSPLAWLPIGLLVFKAANPAAIWVIFISSIWPMIINTAAGVQRIPQDYLNVARVLNLSEWKVFTRILFPAVLPFVLTGGVGIGFWVWDEWNNLNVQHIIIAIFVVGIVGLLLEQMLLQLAKRVTHGADL